MTENEQEVVYSPRAGIGFGPAVWLGMWRQLLDARELTWRLFMRDFSARYRQSVLGYAWAVVSVVLTVATFTWLNRAKVLPIGETPLPYPLFLLLNTTLWYVFANGLLAAANSLVQAGNLITKVNFPREALVFAAFGHAIFELVLRLALLAIAFPLFGATPRVTVLLLPLLVVPLAFWTLGLGLLAALANGISRDVGQILGYGLNFAMLLSPVIYPAPSEGIGLLLLRLNPIAPFLVAGLDLTTRGTLTQPLSLLVSSGLGLVVFLFSWRVFLATGPRVAERI